MRAGLAILLFSAGACSPDAGGGDEPDAGRQGQQCTPGGSFDLDGRYGVLATLNVHVNASGLVETDTTAEILLLLDGDQTARDVAVTARLCDIVIPDVPIAGQDQPIHFEPGPGLIASVGEVSAGASLDGDQTCAAFTSDLITMIIGARLDPPTGGVLPQANDSGTFPACLPAGASCVAAITQNCACDQEPDGKPGATLLIMNAPAVNIDAAYVNLRTSFRLRGEVWSSDLIRGEIDATLEQGILACHKGTGAMCAASEVSTVKSLNPVISQLPDEPSTFRAVRVDAALSCADLLAQRDTLFPR